MKSKWFATGQVVLGAALWGTWSLYLRPLHLPSALSAPIVLVMMGVFSIPLFARDQVVPVWDRTTWYWFAILSLGDAINMASFFAAMSKTTVAVAVLTHYFAPILVALLAPYVDGQRVRFAVPSALLAMTGLVLVLQPWDPSHVSGDVLVGGMLGTLSACAYASNIFSVNRLATRIGAARAQGYHFFVSAVLLAPLAFLVPWDALNTHAVGILALGSLITGTWAGWIFVRGMRTVGSARSAILAYTEPLVAVVVGYLAFREELPPIALVGGALIVTAGVIVSSSQNAT